VHTVKTHYIYSLYFSLMKKINLCLRVIHNNNIMFLEIVNKTKM